jgi:hypothetical protein
VREVAVQYSTPQQQDMQSAALLSCGSVSMVM